MWFSSAQYASQFVCVCVCVEQAIAASSMNRRSDQIQNTEFQLVVIFWAVHNKHRVDTRQAHAHTVPEDKDT